MFKAYSQAYITQPIIMYNYDYVAQPNSNNKSLLNIIIGLTLGYYVIM